MKTILSLAAAAVLLSACATPTVAPVAAGNCSGLKGRQLGQQQATVTDAQLVADAPGVPGHCLVKVSLNDSTLRFESRLPLAGWNGKMVTLGGGGFKGAPFPPTRLFFSKSIITERYATMATNGGYDYPTRDAGYYRAQFAWDPVKFADYTNLSIHRSYPLGKELVQAF